jgi:hypothetical protein
LNQSFPTSKSTDHPHRFRLETGEKKSRPDWPTFWENLKCAGLFYQKGGVIARLKPKGLIGGALTGGKPLYMV